jgi:SAM-dependent methyltransferase
VISCRIGLRRQGQKARWEPVPPFEEDTLMSMSPWAERLADKYFGDSVHPYRIFENTVRDRVNIHRTLLDAGCGYEAPVLRKFIGSAKQLIGVDLVTFDGDVPGITLVNRDLVDTGLPDASVDVIMSRSVMEHIVDPENMYREMHRLLRPGGYFIFLTGNMWDYSAIIAMLVPNRFHPWIVARTQGRDERDTFPVAYKTNTRRAVAKYAGRAGFEVESFEYLGQYPAYFMFNGPLFLVGTAYEKLINRYSALHFLQGWILVVLRKMS